MHKLIHLAASVALCAVAASAQTTFVFDVVQSSSNFTWSGTSSLGNIVGNPSNAFQLAGTTNLDLVLQSGAQPFASGAFSGGAAAAVPDLHGRINNVLPFLPPLATIDVLGLVLSPTSPSFTVGVGGAFTGSVSLTALAGSLVVTPLGSAPTSTPLAGSSSAPGVVNGTLTLVGGALRLNAPVNSSFAFSDPTSGASGTITVVGTLVAQYPLVASFCAGDGTGAACPCGNTAPAGSGRGCLNSTGVGALLAVSGAPVVSADTLVLSASGMPATGTTLFFQGTGEAGAGAGVVFGDGKRCAAGTVTRLGTKTNAGGASGYPVAGDLSVSVRGVVPAAGATRTYQAWYRNSASFCTPDGFNLTNGVRVAWIP
ncbi:MAG: hypothetical protein NTY35_07260 [Planctomycetota bacterium]|nr:hypothetical protein [Planctomycetota bacterium]